MLTKTHPDSSRISVVNPVEYSGWDTAASDPATGSPFQTAAWAEVLMRSYGYTPFYFVQPGANGTPDVLPLMQISSPLTGTRGVALPFTDFVWEAGTELDGKKDLLKKVIELGKRNRWKSFELRGGQTATQETPASERYYTHDLNLLREPGEIWSGLSTNMRRNLRRAEKSDIRVTFENSLGATKSFYRLNCLTRKRHGLPPQPYKFFLNLHACILKKGGGSLLMAEAAGKPLAGAIFLHFGNKAIYKYGASDMACNHTRANHLVMWRAIQWYASQGFASFNFGRTDRGHAGLRRYKLSWGATEKELFYYKFDFRAGTYLKGGAKTVHYQQALAKLPSPILRVIGELMYKHVG